MAFMVPVAEYFTTDECVDSLPSFKCSDCGETRKLINRVSSGELEAFCLDCAPPRAGWYARLSAPGYWDATDWSGPFETESEALQEIMEVYEVDENGNAWDQGE